MTLAFCPECGEAYDGEEDLEELDESFEDCLGSATCTVTCRRCGTKLNLNADINWTLTRRE